ncbi:MAG: hypothetical protein JRF72_17515 [Deltaproteobacteria bacterium]|jgi:hypothetical protein|nr:hypothetical protein [Deltaproteobacteria bacterium]
MKDDLGLYYYPFPDNKRVRMYVRKGSDTIWFRLWNADDPKLWEEHGWVPYDAIEQARAIYTGKGFDPRQAYDLDVAKEIIRENN